MATGLGARLRPELAGILFGCLCLGATNALSLTIPWLIKGAIDALRGSGRAAGSLHALVVRNAALIAGFAIAQALIRTWSRIFIFNAGRNVEYRLRGDVFRHLLRLDAGFYRGHPTGDVMSRLTNDLGSVRAMFGPGLLNLCNTALVYATTVWLLVHLSPRLTLFALLPYPALVGRGAALLAQDVQRQPPASRSSSASCRRRSRRTWPGSR